jgi:hypothetical protein
MNILFPTFPILCLLPKKPCQKPRRVGDIYSYFWFYHLIKYICEYFLSENQLIQAEFELYSHNPAFKTPDVTDEAL